MYCSVTFSVIWTGRRFATWSSRDRAGSRGCFASTPACAGPSRTIPTVTLAALAQRNFVVVAPDEAAFDVISKLRQKHATMAVVVTQPEEEGAMEVVGVIAKEHIADAVASSIRIFPENRRGAERSRRSGKQLGDSHASTRAKAHAGKEGQHET
ncbi:CBS domain-containing protein [Burkholderia vietnamiensis]|nr:CBS domain-containing protein [Burkholderia vietnamiensis]